jgi:hypothetical protein
LHVDFATNTIVYPPGTTDDERTAIATQVLAVGKPSPSYARYRQQWLAPIVARYAAAGTPVFFVRIPTRPAHRSPVQLPSGSLVDIAQNDGARLIPAAKYLALERPALFADEDHLNREGSLLFSRLLGSDVAGMLAAPARGVPASLDFRLTARPAHPAPERPVGGPPAGSRSEHHSLSWFAAACGIGIPLRFQSYEFWLFFAIVAALFYWLPRRAGRYVLLIASYYFYARWNAWYVLFLWILTASDFAIGIWVERVRAAGGRHVKLLLGAGIAANLAFTLILAAERLPR